ncbi:3-phytase [Pilimelia terevasa]|uniref:3-phytase n=1 Tax=Pilimelia terevasa TaxID=53372 RepID=A0A8J3FJN7_9ACTN|nr:esterase-like activity of phytase family protein [Pilimelia terevasa]GGK24566.1 3-phytase [Pilimelia terevasa]
MHTRRQIRTALAVLLLLAGTPAAAAAAPAGPLRVTRYLGEQRLAHRMPFADTVVGGLSGIDRDPRTGTWYLISDDRWRYNPARFYTGQLAIDPVTGAFTGATLTGVSTLRRPDGTPYPAFGQPGSADPESIRVDPRGRGLLWSSEGDRPDAANPTIPLAAGFLRWVDPTGRHLGALPLPRNLRLTTADSGPRRNYGIEALAVTREVVAAAVEGPRYEDGPQPTILQGATARITVWHRRSGTVAQYAYPIDPLPATPVPAGGATDSGVSELLAVDRYRYLALERSWIEGVNYRVKLYEVDLAGATDVAGRAGLAGGRSFRPAAKRLVLDLGAQAQPVQNLESLAWGPRLPGGECTLVIGSDDNFDSREITQFQAFALRGC